MINSFQSNLYNDNWKTLMRISAISDLFMRKGVVINFWNDINVRPVMFIRTDRVATIPAYLSTPTGCGCNSEVPTV